MKERQDAIQESEKLKQTRASRERERANRNLRRCGSLIWPLLKNLGPEELDVTQLGCVRERFLLFFSVNQSLHHLNVEDVNFNEK